MSRRLPPLGNAQKRSVYTAIVPFLPPLASAAGPLRLLAGAGRRRGAGDAVRAFVAGSPKPRKLEKTKKTRENLRKQNKIENADQIRENLRNPRKRKKTTKTQENTSKELINCILILKDVVKTESNRNTSVNFNNCRTGNMQNIIQEIYKRAIMPFYIPIFIIIALFLIIKSKDQDGYAGHKIKIFIFGFASIIFSEISIKFVNSNIYENILLFSLPLIFFIILYFFFTLQLKVKR